MKRELKQLLNNALTPQWLEREMAFVIDIIISLTIAIFPSIGWIVGLLYFIFRDSIPFSKGQSFGKSVYGLKIIDATSGLPLTSLRQKAILRNLIVLIPGLNIFDIYHFLKTGRRLADIWTDTQIIKIKSE